MKSEAKTDDRWIDWLIDDWLVRTLEIDFFQMPSDWLIEWLIDLSIDCLVDWLIDWLATEQSIDEDLDKLIDWLIWLKSVSFQVSFSSSIRLCRLLIDWLTGRLIDELVDWSVDWLIDWLMIPGLIDWMNKWKGEGSPRLDDVIYINFMTSSVCNKWRHRNNHPRSTQWSENDVIFQNHPWIFLCKLCKGSKIKDMHSKFALNLKFCGILRPVWLEHWFPAEQLWTIWQIYNAILISSPFTDDFLLLFSSHLIKPLISTHQPINQSNNQPIN